MTSELVSTETAVVGADKPQTCPGAFINNKKCWPSVKNTPTRGTLFFFHIIFSYVFMNIQIGGTEPGVQWRTARPLPTPLLRMSNPQGTFLRLQGWGVAQRWHTCLASIGPRVPPPAKQNQITK